MSFGNILWALLPVPGVAQRIDAVGGSAGRRWGLRIGRRLIGPGPPDGKQGRPQASVGIQNPVVATAVDARRRNDMGQAVERLEGREAKLMASVHIGLGDF